MENDGAWHREGIGVNGCGKIFITGRLLESILIIVGKKELIERACCFTDDIVLEIERLL